MDCMILGNGPSLLTASLPDLPSYGCNYIGKFYQPTYYCCFDSTVIRNDDLIFPTAQAARIAYLRFFNTCDHTPAPLYALPHVVLVTRQSYVIPGESSPTGASSVYMMLKIAFHAFDTVYLYGVDHTTEHFSSDWPKGVLPSLNGREKHYRLVADLYRKAGKRIINRSAPSILDTIFSIEKQTIS
jgi:hypothetical protein